MDFKTDILIVGAGPTGLMMACQLSRFGISFKIIDKAADRAHESRAIGIQAKSMEIFQNLDIAADFLKRSEKVHEVRFYFNKRLRFAFNFQHIEIKDTPFPNVFLLPQSETEQILIHYLTKMQVSIERQKELISFNQTAEGVMANIKNLLTNESEIIKCRYIIGCDGAKSTVRHQLDIPFVGGSYDQEFVLADASVKWPFSQEAASLFVTRKGILGHIPLHKHYSRLVMSGMGAFKQEELPTLEDIEHFAKQVIGLEIKLENPRWISYFHLHHRVVQYYQKDRAFLVGDAAHIHSPIGAQGMNTGFQDAANLAWKIAFVLKYRVPAALLDTYQIERQPIGKMLLKTTDRIFGWIASRNFMIILLRQHVIPYLLHFLTRFPKFQNKIFSLISQLAIHYPENAFIIEKKEGADDRFLAGPKAGFRAPDAPVNHSTLFEIFREKPCHLLIFQSTLQLNPEQEKKILEWSKVHPDLIAIHRYIQSPDHQILFDRYGVTSSALYFIRPDGYIAFRAFGHDFENLGQYLAKLFGTIE